LLTDQQVSFVQRYFSCLETERAAELVGMSGEEGRATMQEPAVKEGVSIAMQALLDDVAVQGRRIHDGPSDEPPKHFIVKVMHGRDLGKGPYQ